MGVYLSRGAMIRRYLLIFGITAVVIAAGLWFWFLKNWNGWGALIAWLIGINISTFISFGYDKRQAQRAGVRGNASCHCF